MFSVLTQKYAQERYGEEKRQEGWEEGWKEARAEFRKREAKLKEEVQEAAARMRREKALKIAKNFLVGLNLPLDVVAKYAELPLDDVKKLAKSTGK